MSGHNEKIKRIEKTKKDERNIVFFIVLLIPSQS